MIVRILYKKDEDRDDAKLKWFRDISFWYKMFNINVCDEHNNKWW